MNYMLRVGAQITDNRYATVHQNMIGIRVEEDNKMNVKQFSRDLTKIENGSVSGSEAVTGNGTWQFDMIHPKDAPRRVGPI
jgi:hypothetical protein